MPFLSAYFIKNEINYTVRILQLNYVTGKVINYF